MNWNKATSGENVEMGRIMCLKKVGAMRRLIWSARHTADETNFYSKSPNCSPFGRDRDEKLPKRAG